MRKYGGLSTSGWELIDLRLKRPVTQLNIKIGIVTIEGKISTFVAGVVRLDLHELDRPAFFVDARLRLRRRKTTWLRLILSGKD